MKYYTDGFNIISNPSEYGGGYTITDENGTLISREVIRKKGFTNNEGEILGILKALDLAKEGDTVSTDSMCCLTWANKGKSKARPDLYEILQKCKTLLKGKNINLMWEGRNFNLAGLLNEKDETKWEASITQEEFNGEYLTETKQMLWKNL